MFKKILILERSEKAVQGLFLKLKVALINDVAKIKSAYFKAQPGLSLIKMYGWQGKNIFKMRANY